MTKIIPLDPAQNIYANDKEFKVVGKQSFRFEGRTVQKLTYRDAHSLIWKIGQIALAALVTLATLFILLCFTEYRVYWKSLLDQFKDRIVYQNDVLQSTTHAAFAPTVTHSLATIVQSNVPPVVPAAQLSAAAIKEDFLKENPEYGNAIKAWENKGLSLNAQVLRLEELRQYAFGTDKWVKHFGEIVGTVPPLPEDIYEICNSKDLYKPKELVKDTHVLVLVPEAVMMNGNRFDITLRSLGELAQAPKCGGHSTQYSCLRAGGHENKPVEKSHWALMKKEIIPGSSNQTSARQVQMVDEYSKQAKVQYIVPNAIDAATCILMNFVSTGNRLFESNWWPDSWMHIRCQELVDGIYDVNIGCFNSEGLSIICFSPPSGSCGAGALRKF